MKKLASILIGLLLPSITLAAPAVSGVSGTLSHGESVTIAGSAFGSKSQAAPVAWDNLEDGACNTTATVGTWSSVNGLSISTSNQRHANSTRNATAQISGTTYAYFTGGSDSQTWYAQYWWYVPSDFAYRNANIKMFRFWSTSGSDNNNWFFSPHPGGDTGHGCINLEGDMGQYPNRVYYSGSCPPDSTAGWYPVTASYASVDAVFGHTTNCSDWLTNGIEWRYFDTDMPHSNWHLFQVEYRDSDIDTYNGVIRIWADGRLIIDKSNVRSRTTSGYSNYKRPKEVGWMNSLAADAIGDFFIDDAYIDNTWARVEIGNANTYAACTHREIQPATAWATGEIAVTLNRGSFGATDTAYLYVVDADGAVNSSGYEITFGDTETTVAPPTISNVTISNGRVQ